MTSKLIVQVNKPGKKVVVTATSGRKNTGRSTNTRSWKGCGLLLYQRWGGGVSLSPLQRRLPAGDRVTGSEGGLCGAPQVAVTLLIITKIQCFMENKSERVAPETKDYVRRRAGDDIFVLFLIGSFFFSSLVINWKIKQDWKYEELTINSIIFPLLVGNDFVTINAGNCLSPLRFPAHLPSPRTPAAPVNTQECKLQRVLPDFRPTTGFGSFCHHLQAGRHAAQSHSAFGFAAKSRLVKAENFLFYMKEKLSCK